MDNNFAITEYPDAEKVTKQLDELIKKPIYTIRKDALKKYEEEYFEKKCSKSKEMINKAKEIIPGGVQHNLAFNYPFPLVFTKAEGAYLYDIDGNRYYDFLQAGGPTVLGSNPPEVREKVIELLNECGPSTGLFHEYEYKLAKKISENVKTVEMFRMLGSGTEACMAAIRVARLATKKKYVLKMGGAYHGWSDQLAYGIRIPGTKFTQANGVPRHVFKYTQEFFPNDLSDLERKLRLNQFRGGTAAVLIEPVGPESGTRPLDKDFNKGVEALCRKYGALLIFDEVVTGFRIGMAGAQGYFGVSPDLTTFGKVVAGGYPGAGGLGGKKEYMKYLASGIEGGVKQKKALTGGTMSANPLSCAAGYYTLCEIERTNAAQKAGNFADKLIKGIQDLIEKYHLPFVAFNQGSICHLETVGTMHYAINWSKPWQIPDVLKAVNERKEEMEHIGAAYMAEGLVTLAGSRLYTSAAYNDDMLPDILSRFENVFTQVAKKSKPEGIMNINYAKSLVIKAGIDLVESGLIARTWGNVSCRIDENSFVITPSGRDYRTLTQDEIVQVNISDLRYEGNIKPSSEKGMHAEVYKLYPHINFVIHTHQSNASVIAASEVNSVKLNSRYPLLNGEVICAKYGLPGTKLLRKNVVEALMNSETHAVIMKYHGALCFGKDYDETFMAASDLEKACSEFIINQYLKLSGKNEYNDIDMYKFALSLNSVRHENDFTIYDSGKEMEVKRDSLTEICLPKEEAEIYKCIFRSNKDINYILFENSPEIQAVSQSNVKINPILDDFAQIVGSYTKNVDKNPIQVTKALKKSPVVFIRGLGALFCGKTFDDAEAVKLVTRKQCKAFLGASLFGNVKPIKPLECRLMRFVYLNKYSKMVSKK